MAFSVEMPALGESVTEGTITRWLKQEGDTVEVDEPLLEVSTDKVDTEIPSPVAGTLSKIIAQEDDTIDIGGELALIDDGSGAPADDSDTTSAPAEEASSDDSADADDSAEADSAESAASGSSEDSGSGEGEKVLMPELGESVTEGTVTNWLKAVGDTVEVDEPLLEVSTDKVDTEIPSPVAGTLLEVLANEDDTVEVGGTLAIIGSGSAPKAAPKTEEKPAEKTPEPAPKAEEKPAEKAPEPAPEAEEKPAPKTESAPEPARPAAPAAAASSGSAPYVTPLVRKIADEKGVDLSTVEGTGVGGRIRKQDVLAAAEGGSASGAGSAKRGGPSQKGVRPELAELRGTTQEANRIRKITALRTREALQSTAQLTQVFEVDMSRVGQLRSASKADFQAKHGVKLTYLPFYAKAAVEALVSHPNVNASYDEQTNTITYHDHVHLGIAVDTEQGLLSPVIKNADKMSVAELAKAIVEIADKARNRKLGPDDLSGGTFTITNIGSEGALFDTPILVPPQAAMLGTGAIVRRPIVEIDEDGESIAIRSMGYLPLTYDHRLIDGADAGRFLTTIKDRLETGAFEDELGL
ncbi:2-oxoglutarate dehydrogenase, E2 component, dihydrolipoamide succinyltransferase [Dietzia sp.]|uniref:2-oxoglutarate dehydrogenase, E2 component, dihydrolipoamide succinyltransferase n=1 Tax=Dietzia sp. TaxID=1871616 RepID=UPI002FD9CF38